MKSLVPSSKGFILLFAIVAALLVTGHATGQSKESDKAIQTVEVESDEVYDSEEETYENNNKETTYSEPAVSEAYYGPPPPPPPPPSAYFSVPYGPPPPPPPGYETSAAYPSGGYYQGPANYSTSYASPSAYPSPSYPTPSYPAPSYSAPSYPAPAYSAPSYYEAPKYQASENYSAGYSEASKYSAPSYPSTPSYSAPATSYPEPQKYSAPSYPSAPASYPETPSYSAPAPSSYSSPTTSYPEPQKYSAPSYPSAPASYPETPSYPAPAQSSYSPPAPSSYSPPAQGSYSGPTTSYPEPQKYSAPSYPAPSSYASAPSYSAPASYPEQAPASYSAPAASYPEPQKYSAPSYNSGAREYSPATPSYSAPSSSYSAPSSSYSAPSASAPSYSAPTASQAYKSPAVTYRSSYPTVTLQYPQNLVSATYHPAKQQQPASYNNYTRHMLGAYEPNDSPWGDDALPPSWWVYQVPVGGYKGDINYRLPLNRNYQRNYNVAHPQLSYYATAPYRHCPRDVYKRPPTDYDYRAAFNYAVSKLRQQNYASVTYLNTSTPSYAARHQIFSSWATGNSRADEQGLLVEYASEYLANRACLTKWDKQRYLPTLTLGATFSVYPSEHSCQHYGQQKRSAEGWNLMEATKSRYRTVDGFGNNPYHPYWGKSNVCHIRLLTPDYADGISEPRTSYLPQAPLPNARAVSNYIHKDIHLQGPYNMLKMQWGQFINHDITNTQLSSYDGLVDCCKTPNVRGCYPIYVQPNDKHYQKYNVTCLNFVRSGVCPLCQFGPRQQINKNTAYLDASQVYGNDAETARSLRLFKDGLLRFSVNSRGEVQLPLVSQGSAKDGQCQGNCYVAGDSRVNQHPALTAMHVLLLRRHNQHARGLAQVHRNWNDELLFQEARRIVIAEYQMITYNEYLPIVFGPILSEYYHLTPGKGYQHNDYTHYNKDVDPTTWNEYSTATCRFGHSQIQNLFGLYPRIIGQQYENNKKQGYNKQQQQYPNGTSTFRLKDWFMNPSLLNDGLTQQIVNGLVSRPSAAVDPWVVNDVRNYLYKSRHERTGGDLAATNIQRGRDHGLPSYTHYLEYCFNHKVKSWQDLSLYIPYDILDQLRKLYVVPENIDLFTGGMSERHFPEADIGPTFACINGIQYYHLKFGDRYYFEHRGQAGSFTPEQLYEIKKSTLARLLCRTAYLPSSPPYAFFYPSQHNPLLDCARLGEIDYRAF